jgi:hypothetical protein
MTPIAFNKTPSTLPQAAMDVQAKGENSVAAGRDVIIDKNTVINEYDIEKARRIEAARFASAMHRECTQYVETVRGLQLQREKGDRSDAMVPSIFSPVYASPETQRLFGEQTYKELNAHQEKMSALRGKVFTMRQQQAMSAAYAMMAQQGGRHAKERLAGNPAPSAEEFLSTKNELLRRIQEHCQYLQSLM